MRRSLGVSCTALLVGAALAAPATARSEPPTPRLPNLLAYPPSWLVGPVTGQIEDWDPNVPDPFVEDGCLPKERAQGARRCLRFMTRVANFDRPPFIVALRVEPSGRNVYQVVRGPHGGTYRPAGTFSVDPFRGEVQLDDFFVTRLWSVRDGRKVAVVAETEPRGFCPALFGLPAPWVSPGKCVHSPVRMGPYGPEKLLGLGWLEHVWIKAHEPGQYIDIAGVPDGRYALEIEVDAGGNFAESYEPDNSTCVEIELRGDRVDTFRPRLCWPPRT